MWEPCEGSGWLSRIDNPSRMDNQGQLMRTEGVWGSDLSLQRLCPVVVGEIHWVEGTVSP